MDLITIILIGIGLAMDCLAVSISKGICAPKFKWKYLFRTALLFGTFQAVMPLISFAAGSGFSEEIKDFDHWIAFLLLSFIGIKMFVEGLKPIAPNCKTDKHPFRWNNLIIMAIATSIDALAAGVIFISYPDQIWELITVIGITSFIFSFVGVFIGIKVHKHLKFNVELVGGLILISIGIKILSEHLFFS